MERLSRVPAALSDWLRDSEDDELRRAFVEWVRRVVLPGRFPGAAGSPVGPRTPRRGRRMEHRVRYRHGPDRPPGADLPPFPSEFHTFVAGTPGRGGPGIRAAVPGGRGRGTSPAAKEGWRTSQNSAQVSGPFRNSLNLMSQRDHDGNLKTTSRTSQGRVPPLRPLPGFSLRGPEPRD